ncbi:hypothetical protein ACOSQ4_017322 [Xanthoceras sorbifolium]
MKQLKGFENSKFPSHICKLEKTFYGLKQAPRAWFSKLKLALLQWGFTNSQFDVSLFYRSAGSKVILLLVYVDDILITGNDLILIQQVIKDLNSCFALKTLGSVNYFLGFEAYRNDDGLFLTQTKYTTDLLAKTNMLTNNPCSTPIAAGTRLSFVIGTLQYLIHTRLDISFIVNERIQFLVAPTVVHWQTCKRILRYLKGITTYGIVFKPSYSLHFKVFCDADWASSIDDRKSTTGCCVFLGGNLITWSSKKQTVVARSNTEADYRSLS